MTCLQADPFLAAARIFLICESESPASFADLKRADRVTL